MKREEKFFLKEDIDIYFSIGRERRQQDWLSSES